MATKPSKSTEWATNASALKSDPSTEQQDYGWSTSDNTISGIPVRPNLQNQNGWQNAVHQWKEYFEQKSDEQDSWFLQNTSVFLSKSSARKLYAKGQTAKVEYTLQGSTIKTGDKFEFKNLGPLNPGNDDIHLIEVKTESANDWLVAWLQTDDEMTIRALIDNPQTASDWEIIKLERPNGLSHALNLDIQSLTGYTGDYVFSSAHAPIFNAWFQVTEAGLIRKTDMYGNNPVTILNNPLYYFDKVLFIPETAAVYVIGFHNATSNALVLRTTDGQNFTTIFDQGGGFYYVQNIFYRPSEDILTLAIDGFSLGFYWSDDNGATWTPSTSFGGASAESVVYDSIRDRYIFYFSVGSQYLISNDGKNLVSTTPSTLNVYNVNSANATIAGTSSSPNLVVFNPYMKIFLLYYRESTSVYRFAYSRDGITFYLDNSQYATSDNLFSSNEPLSMFNANLLYDEIGNLYTQEVTGVVSRQFNPFNAAGLGTSIDQIWSYGYSYRLNRLLGFEGFGPFRTIKSGRL